MDDKISGSEGKIVIEVALLQCYSAKDIAHRLLSNKLYHIEYYRGELRNKNAHKSISRGFPFE